MGRVCPAATPRCGGDEELFGKIVGSAFAHPKWLMRRQLQHMHFPQLLISLVLRYVEFVIGHRFDAIAPVNTLRAIKCPVLLVHGLEDETVPVACLQEIRRSCPDREPKIMLIPEAGHAAVDKIRLHADELVHFLKQAGLSTATDLARQPPFPQLRPAAVAMNAAHGDGDGLALFNAEQLSPRGCLNRVMRGWGSQPDANHMEMLMSKVMTRRTALLGALLSVPAFAALANDETAANPFQALEHKYGGRLGVAALDLATGKRMEHRADERFPMCSTFKFLAGAYILARVDRGEERLDRRITFTRADLVTSAGRVSWSPSTEQRAGTGGMTVGELCEAAITVSDNTAANLLLASFGGPQALTAFLRAIGDQTTRLDRIEPDLNEAAPGDVRDTTSPSAMLESMRKIVFADVLSAALRDQIIAWLVACKTGDKRLRAGFPTDWRVGNKTGTSGNGLVGDIAVVWPPNRGPLVVIVYFDGPQLASEQRDAVIAEVGRIVTV
jgi:beta-lactamase class A